MQTPDDTRAWPTKCGPVCGPPRRQCTVALSLVPKSGWRVPENRHSGGPGRPKPATPLVTHGPIAIRPLSAPVNVRVESAIFHQLFWTRGPRVGIIDHDISERPVTRAMPSVATDTKMRMIASWFFKRTSNRQRSPTLPRIAFVSMTWLGLAWERYSWFLHI